MGFEDYFRVDYTIAEKPGFNPYYLEVESSLGREITIQGKPLISLGSNDYLGLANRSELKQAAVKAIEEYGVSMCGTPIVVGYTELNRRLEDRIASFLGMDAALVFSSGYQANIGMFNLLANKIDVILVDNYSHSSLVQGAKLSRADLLQYAHNDMEELEGFLKAAQDKRMRFIAVDGLFSTEGDTARLDTIVKLAKQYNAFTIVDDAHGLGILGGNGKGTLELYDVLGRIDVVTGSLGKAFGCYGGFIAASSGIADYFRYYCSPFIYSTALPPAMAASAIVAIDLVESSRELRARLEKNKEMLFGPLEEMGFKLSNSTTPLFSIVSKDEEEIIRLTRDLFQKGIYATPFLPPSVPLGHSCLRFIPHAGLEENDIRRVIEVLKEIRGSYT